MSHIVTIPKAINLAPSSLEEEVLQNVAMIISTPQYSVPLDRNFGVPLTAIDKPLPVAKALLISAIYDAVEKYEPRAEIVSISFEEGAQAAMAGVLAPRVEVNIIDGE